MKASSQTIRMIGIDPGYDRCGWAITEDTAVIESGCISTDSSNELVDRYIQIHQELIQIIQKFQPTVAAVEDLYFGKNTKTAIKVAEVRGVIVFTCKSTGLAVVMPKPVEVKSAITGNGHSSKDEVQSMLERIVLYKDDATAKRKRLDDEIDAVGVALTGERLYLASLT